MRADSHKANMPIGDEAKGAMQVNKGSNSEKNMGASMRGMSKGDLKDGHSTTPMDGRDPLYAFDYNPFI